MHANLITKRYADAEEVGRAAAEFFLAHGSRAIAERGRFNVVLSGGSTPRRMYQILAASDLGSIGWATQVNFFWGDERCVPPDHPDSNYGMAWTELLSRITHSPARVHRMKGEAPDPVGAADEYVAEIGQALHWKPGDLAPRADLVFLGMGPDGHTASLFPYTEALKETTRWVVANFVPKFNAWRLTMTPVFLNRARAICFLVAGADKAQTLAEVLHGPPDPDRLPSQRIRTDEGEVTWMIDKAAGALLP